MATRLPAYGPEVPGQILAYEVQNRGRGLQYLACPQTERLYDLSAVNEASCVLC